MNNGARSWPENIGSGLHDAIGIRLAGSNNYLAYVRKRFRVSACRLRSAATMPLTPQRRGQ
jgi:hypothetical protein